MKVANIIHTRTFRCDFNPHFMVRPEDFTESDIKWARKIVLSATSSIDNLQGNRWIVADDGMHRIAGIVCFVSELAKLARVENEATYFVDERGRNIYAFVGIVVKSNENVDGLPTYEELWNAYKSSVAEKWERTVVETTSSEYEEKSFSEHLTSQKPPIKSKRVNNKEFFESSASEDKELFSYYIGNITKDNAFCSNLIDFSAVKSSPFSIVTTSTNIISRLENLKPEEKQNISRDDLPSHGQKTLANDFSSRTEDSKKKSPRAENPTEIIVTCLIIMVVLVTVIIKSCTK
ncbi:MAG: hypothetical protein J6X67_02015 [Treponema sp.]|nr:hypothetical protein [Treponema sp.]